MRGLFSPRHSIEICLSDFDVSRFLLCLVPFRHLSIFLCLIPISTCRCFGAVPFRHLWQYLVCLSHFDILEFLRLSHFTSTRTTFSFFRPCPFVILVFVVPVLFRQVDFLRLSQYDIVKTFVSVPSRHVSILFFVFCFFVSFFFPIFFFFLVEKATGGAGAARERRAKPPENVI